MCLLVDFGEILTKHKKNPLHTQWEYGLWTHHEDTHSNSNKAKTDAKKMLIIPSVRQSRFMLLTQ